MKMIRFITYHASLLNALLIIILVVVIIAVLLPLTRMNSIYLLPQIKTKAPVEENNRSETVTVPAPSDYTIIGEMNLFHPDRIPSVEKKAELPKPELVLYGTMVSDGIHIAFIEDKKGPKTTPGRGNRHTAIRRGDVISGFTVTEMETDRILLVRGKEQITVFLSNGDNKRKRETDARQSPTGTTSPARKPITGRSTPMQAPRIQ
jgi:hypothetical protein